MESIAMKEIRKIRDENSQRHLSSSVEERIKENEKVTEWLIKITKKSSKDTQVS